MKINYQWETERNFTGFTSYDYEVDYKKVFVVIYKTFAKFYKIPQETAKQIIAEFDLYDSCLEFFEEEIKDYFNDDAYQQYCEDKDGLY